MKKSYKGLLILITPYILGILTGVLAARSCSKDSVGSVADGEIREQCAPEAASVPEEADAVAEPDIDDDVDGSGPTVMREVIYHGNRLPYAKLFSDLNDAHVSLAKIVGLKFVPQTRDELKSLKGLVPVTDNDYYVVDELKYSMPFLTRNAAGELMAIAKAFSDSLKSKNLLEYKLVVSSLLRTEEDVKRLRRSGNPNASDNSAHCYGTTFDITYTRYYREAESDAFMQPYELTKVLGEVLRDRKKAGKCLVKYERKEHCFHITSCD